MPPSRRPRSAGPRWHDAASELAAQHAAIDLPLEQARIELAQTRAARDRADRDHRAAEKAAAELGPRLGTIRTLSEGAVEDVRRQTAQLAATAQRLNRALALPGLAAAASAEPLHGVVSPGAAG